ncbi:MAG: hypothetical protein EOM26_12795 [Alphaproteobacteria bacterium]|nr:hypothetical protein [Alphaproteobacteria bacterium]
MPKSFCSGETMVHMSDETADHYGRWAEEFPVWAETQNMKQVIVVTPEDVLNDRNPEDMTFEDKAAALKSFIQNNFPDFPVEAFENDITSLGHDVAFGKGRAEDADLDGDGRNDVGITIGPSRHQTKEEAAASLARLDTDKIGNIRGTDIEWQVMAIAHEIAHHDQPEKSDGKRLIWEVEAEQGMVHFMRSADKKGLLSDIGAVDDHTLVRNLSGFYFKDDMRTHVVGPGVRTPSEGAVPVADEDIDFQNPLHDAQMAIAYEVGKELVGKSQLQDALGDMLRSEGIYSLDSYELPRMDPVHRKTIVDMHKGNLTIDEGLAMLPGETRSQIEDNFRSEIQVAGIGALRDDPALMYETTRRLYQQGDFDSSPVGKQYAYEFLSAAQKFAPEHFGVFDEAEKFVPPGFPQSSQYTPSSHLDRSPTLPGAQW